MSTTTPTHASCPFCPATFGATERWPAADLLADHITDVHQDKLPNLYERGGER